MELHPASSPDLKKAVAQTTEAILAEINNNGHLYPAESKEALVSLINSLRLNIA